MQSLPPWGAFAVALCSLCQRAGGGGVGFLRKKNWPTRISANAADHDEQHAALPADGSCCGLLYSGKLTFHSVISGSSVPAGDAQSMQAPALYGANSSNRTSSRRTPDHSRRGHNGWQRNRRRHQGQHPFTRAQCRAFHRLQGVLRAGGHEAAGVRQHRRNPPLVSRQD